MWAGKKTSEKIRHIEWATWFEQNRRIEGLNCVPQMIRFCWCRNAIKMLCGEKTVDMRLWKTAIRIYVIQSENREREGEKNYRRQKRIRHLHRE